MTRARGMTSRTLAALAAAAALALAGCGGSAGDAGTPSLGTGSGSGSGTGTGSGSGTVAAGKLALALSSSTVTSATPAVVTARLTTASGSALPGVVVKFETDPAVGVLSAATALTDADGVATVSLTPTAGNASGAATVKATAVVGTETITDAAGFQSTATNVSIQSLSADIGAAQLAPYGQTAIDVVLSGSTAGVPVTVNLTSACVTRARATLTPAASVSTTTGRATFTLKDGGCGAFDSIDTLQASIAGSTAPAATLKIALAAPQASSIGFVSASPAAIYLRGTGLAENSTVTFQVRDASGLGVPQRDIVLEATTLAGGLLVDGQSGPVTKKTDANGNVSVLVNSGTVPTPVRIKATLSGTTVTTVSSALSIAVGLPSQLNFSLSQAMKNIEGYSIDGTANSYAVIASDRLGNPVPDGTAINFVTEAGQIQAITQTQTSGGLSSTTARFQSSEPRPVDGRVTVLAYALGEESFIDQNGNNVYDAGEPYMGLGNVYLDRFFDIDPATGATRYDPALDQFVALSLPGQSASGACPNPSLPGGLLDPRADIPSVPGTCDGKWGQAYVRRAVQTVFSTSSARLLYGRSLPGGAVVAPGACPSLEIALIPPIGSTDPAPYNADGSANTRVYYRFGGAGIYGAGKNGVFGFTVADANPVAANPVAAGSTITAAATQGLTATVVGGSPVPSTLSPTGALVQYAFDDQTTDGIVTVNVRAPSGLVTTFSQSISRGPAPNGWTSCP